MAELQTRICDKSCKHWCYDMDLDPFCMHPKAVEQNGSFGINTNAMGRLGLCTLKERQLWEARDVSESMV